MMSQLAGLWMSFLQYRLYCSGQRGGLMEGSARDGAQTGQERCNYFIVCLSHGFGYTDT